MPYTPPSSSGRRVAPDLNAAHATDASRSVESVAKPDLSRMDDAILKRFETLFSMTLKSAVTQRDALLNTTVRLSDRNLVMASVSQALFEAYKHSGITLSVDTLPDNIDQVYIEAARRASFSLPFKNLKEKKDLDRISEGKLALNIKQTFATFKKSKLIQESHGGLALSDAWRFCIDPLKAEHLQHTLGFATDNPLFPFIFDTDPGYLHGMSQAWCYALEHSQSDEPTDVALILELHRLSMLIADSKDAQFCSAGTGFRMARGLGFTAEGAEELREFAALIRKLMWPHYSVEASQNECNAAFRSGMTDADFDAWLSSLDIQQRDVLHLIRPKVPEESLAFITGFWLQEYEKMPKESEEEKLFAIVDLCQKLERTHPFNQGNNRVFCVLLLNVLLLKNHLPMSMVLDPNMFDGFSTEQTMALVRDGWQRVDGWRKKNPG